MTPAYRQWLQGIVNGTVSPVTGINKTEASALLQVVGDDGKIDARFIEDPYAFTGDDRGQVFSTTEGTGNNVGYGPQGINTVNDAYMKLYMNEYPEGYTPPAGSTTGSGGTTTVDPDAALRNQLRGEIGGYSDDVDSLYASLFADLEALIKARDAELETQYGGQFKKAADQYAGALPEIETSYAAIGASDSTDQSDAKTGAKKGFDETTETIGKNKQTDKAKLGQYKTENATKFTEDRDNAKRNIGRAGSETNVDALRGLRNDVETNLSTGRVTQATLGTDGSARKAVSDLTADSGRFDTAIGALDSILKSSMSGAVKEAAVKAVTDNAGLSDEEKKKVQETYGNVYVEQAAL